MTEPTQPPGTPSEPVAVDINVDAALVLKSMVGIDEYPQVLALMPNIYRPEDQHRVHAAIVTELADAGIVHEGSVHTRVAHWLRCLERPDMELAARVVHTGLDGQPASMLRLSLVRRAEEHILAIRCDDRVVLQPVFHEGRKLTTLTSAVLAALGPYPPLAIDTLAATMEQFAAVPAEPEQRRRALLALGATAHTAATLTRALDEVIRRAEIVTIEHRDGTDQTPQFSLSVLDTPRGRIVAAPARALDGGKRSTYTRGDAAAIGSGIAALIELLPSGSWFDTSRTTE
ncbi:ESX secretion-associated protein EspG [Nocardia sp. NPDC005978]|uniref:ESX secretion-associated protein EspG n=1 Tax=Nocardia sp. NPDC005978 TaxID=3156725 RepID=UPI0033ACC5DE